VLTADLVAQHMTFHRWCKMVRSKHGCALSTTY